LYWKYSNETQINNLNMPKHLISEQTVIEAVKKGQKTLGIQEGAIITSAAKDRAAALGVKFVAKSGPEREQKSVLGNRPKGEETIVIGCDHGGYSLKQALIPLLENMGYKVVDVGTYSEEPCDYPDYAYMVARMVSLGEVSRGIMVDAVGVASAMVANKVPGVRAACCTTEFAAKSCREHNDANVLTLGGRVLGVEAAKSIATTWLETWFGGGRHKGRVDKITEIEKRYLK
jgi:ribose 5-phosphate isomerase B